MKWGGENCCSTCYLHLTNHERSLLECTVSLYCSVLGTVPDFASHQADDEEVQHLSKSSKRARVLAYLVFSLGQRR